MVILFSRYEYLSLTKFEAEFLIWICGQKGEKEKNEVPYLRVQTEKMSLVRYLLHLWVQRGGSQFKQTFDFRKPVR